MVADCLGVFDRRLVEPKYKISPAAYGNISGKKEPEKTRISVEMHPSRFVMLLCAIKWSLKYMYLYFILLNFDSFNLILRQVLILSQLNYRLL